MLVPSFDLPTHAEAPSGLERSRDTPDAVTELELFAGVRVSFATQPPPADLSRSPSDSTGGGATLRPAPRPQVLPRPDGDAVERLQHTRMTLLRRADRGDALTTEDEARYAYATARLERLVPRVTAADFERLADMADEIADLGEELDGIRAELDEEAASASGRRKR